MKMSFKLLTISPSFETYSLYTSHDLFYSWYQTCFIKQDKNKGDKHQIGPTLTQCLKKPYF